MPPDGDGSKRFVPLNGGSKWRKQLKDMHHAWCMILSPGKVPSPPHGIWPNWSLHHDHGSRHLNPRHAFQDNNLGPSTDHLPSNPESNLTLQRSQVSKHRSSGINSSVFITDESHCLPCPPWVGHLTSVHENFLSLHVTSYYLNLSNNNWSNSALNHLFGHFDVI